MKISAAKFDFFYLTPLIVLLWSLFSYFFLPIIPIASGFGGDGVFYGQVALDFQNMIGTIDSYRANRIFPGVFIHYLYILCNLPLNLDSVLLGFRIYNIFIIVLSSFFWVLISLQLALKPYTKWIGFIALFVNLPLLNIHFYNPVLTDGTAFLLGIIMLYSYIKKSNVLLLIVTILSFFSWPVGIIIGFTLFIYSNIENFQFYYKKKNTHVVVFILLLSPLLAIIGFNLIGEIKHLLLIIGLDGKFFREYDPSEYKRVNLLHLINALVNATFIVMVFWYTLKNFDILKFIRRHFEKRLILRIIGTILILFLLVGIKKFLYSPSTQTLSPIGYFTYYFTGANVRFPLQFVVFHITYWGPVIILFILFFKNIIHRAQVIGIPIMFGFLFTVILSINSESRPIINFYPFIVLIIVQSIDFTAFNNKRQFLILFLIVSVIYSKIWLPIELPHTVFPNTDFSKIDEFPMQWYFMNFGLFANTKMYWIHAISSLLCFVAFFYAIRYPIKNFYGYRTIFENNTKKLED